MFRHATLSLVALTLLLTSTLHVSAAPRSGAAGPTLEWMRTLPGTTSLLVLEDGRQVVARNADRPLAVGSSFKMAVLLGLWEQIQSGRRRWTDVVHLEPSWKVPGGVLYPWPAGSPVTLHTLAGFMISHSDNTATDALVHIVGREGIEPHASRNRPLLTTHDLFMFRNLKVRPYLERWRRGDEAARRQVLRELDAMPLSENEKDYADGPYALDAEWYFTNRELCGLSARVAHLAAMQIEPLAADRKDWAQIAYKGGSEPGVISTTFTVRRWEGRTFCVSGTWNNTRRAVDNELWVKMMGRLLKGLARS